MCQWGSYLSEVSVLGQVDSMATVLGSVVDIDGVGGERKTPVCERSHHQISLHLGSTVCMCVCVGWGCSHVSRAHVSMGCR